MAALSSIRVAGWLGVLIFIYGNKVEFLELNYTITIFFVSIRVGGT